MIQLLDPPASVSALNTDGETERALDKILQRVPPILRLPRPRERCPYTGLSRTGMVGLVSPCQRTAAEHGCGQGQAVEQQVGAPGVAQGFAEEGAHRRKERREGLEWQPSACYYGFSGPLLPTIIRLIPPARSG